MPPFPPPAAMPRASQSPQDSRFSLRDIVQALCTEPCSSPNELELLLDRIERKP